MEAEIGLVRGARNVHEDFDAVDADEVTDHLVEEGTTEGTVGLVVAADDLGDDGVVGLLGHEFEGLLELTDGGAEVVRLGGQSVGLAVELDADGVREEAGMVFGTGGEADVFLGEVDGDEVVLAEVSEKCVELFVGCWREFGNRSWAVVSLFLAQYIKFKEELRGLRVSRWADRVVVKVRRGLPNWVDSNCGLFLKPRARRRRVCTAAIAFLLFSVYIYISAGVFCSSTSVNVNLRFPAVRFLLHAQSLAMAG